MDIETARARLIAEMMDSNPRFSPRRAINIAEAIGEQSSAVLERAYATGSPTLAAISDDYWWCVASQYLDQHPEMLADYIADLDADARAEMIERRAA
ncbi:hypothetical protein [Chitiniphilus shinanonensis]|uniref:hypothetical protein n=1 Tax=Chitiniphilus shinanonensis TaxID=553088 RepID=UPI003046ECF2